jgi:predicted nucleic-acid-binding protein
LIGIDTNVLARYIFDDDPIWSPAAQKFIDDECTLSNPGYINLIVLTELIWLLGVTSGWSKPQIITVISDLLLADNLVLEQPLLVEAALNNYKNGRADFADYLISAINQHANVNPTITIDRLAAKDSGFVRLNRGKS